LTGTHVERRDALDDDLGAVLLELTDRLADLVGSDDEGERERDAEDEECQRRQEREVGRTDGLVLGHRPPA
jgi:hypothetical protein